MAYVTGKRVASLADQLASSIDLKHAALQCAVAERADPMVVCRLVGEIWSLSDEFACALYVEGLIEQVRRRDPAPKT